MQLAHPTYVRGIVLILLAALGIACAAPTQPGGLGTPADQPKSGGVINELFNDDPVDFDPTINGQSGTNGNSVRYAYDSLLTYKTTPGVDGNYWENTLTPNLAERWEVSQDAKTFTFHLRKDLKFANLPPVHGRALTSADVKFSYEYLARFGPYKDLPPSQQAYAFEGLEGIDTPDPSTVVVRFKEAFAPFVTWSAAGFILIFPREIYEQDGSFSKQMVGSNAFQLDRATTQQGSSWSFKKNSNFREDGGKPYLDGIRGIVIKDDATAKAGFQTKQIDVLATTSGGMSNEVRQANPNAAKYDRISAGYFLWLHNKNGPTSNPLLRKAIALALNQDAFIKTVANGEGQWSLGIEVPNFELFSQDEIKKMVPYDPERAKQLVKEAGYPNGVDIELNYSVSSGQTWITMAELVNAQLKQIGVNATLKGNDYLISARNRQTSNFQMDLITIRPRVDADGVLFPSFYPGQRPNYAQVDDAKLTSLLAAQRKEIDPIKRRELIKQAVVHISTEVVPLANLYAPLNSTYWHPYVHDYTPHADVLYMRNIWLDR